MAALVGGTLALPAAFECEPGSACEQVQEGRRRARARRRSARAGRAAPPFPGRRPTRPSRPRLRRRPPTSATSRRQQPGPGWRFDHRPGDDQRRRAERRPVGLAAEQRPEPRARLRRVSSSRPVRPPRASPLSYDGGHPRDGDPDRAIGTSNDNAQLNVVSDPQRGQSVSLERQCFTTGSFACEPSDTRRARARRHRGHALERCPALLERPVVRHGAVRVEDRVLQRQRRLRRVRGDGDRDAGHVDRDRHRLRQRDDRPRRLRRLPAAEQRDRRRHVDRDGEARLRGTSGRDLVNLSSDQPGIATPVAGHGDRAGRSAERHLPIATTAIGMAHISADSGTGGPQQAALDVNRLGT